MNDRYVAYAGTYTHESSKGIHIYDMDVEKGRITERCEVTIDNPSYITLSSNKKYLDRAMAFWYPDSIKALDEYFWTEWKRALLGKIEDDNRKEVKKWAEELLKKI